MEYYILIKWRDFTLPLKDFWSKRVKFALFFYFIKNVMDKKKYF